MTAEPAQARGIRFDDAKRFYETIRPALAPREIENSLLLGIANWLARSGEPAFMLALQSERGPIAAAVRVAPHQLSISSLETDTTERLADTVLTTGEPIPSVIGSWEQASHFAEHWSTRTGATLRPELEMTLYALNAVVPPAAPAAGALRAALPEDQGWLTDWFIAFAEEVGLPTVERSRGYAEVTVRRKTELSQLFVWEDRRRPVAIAAFSNTGITGARIGSVMTAPDDRGKGYGSALVAALTQHLLDGGKRWCGLFADVANPQSNRIYQRLGYAEVCRFRSLRFGEV